MGTRPEDAIRPELSTDEWLLVVEAACQVVSSRSNEEIRFQSLEHARRLVPYEAAAFYLADPSDNTLGGCMIAQPAGVEIPADEFSRFLLSSWKRRLAGCPEEGQITAGGNARRAIPEETTWAEVNETGTVETQTLGSGELKDHHMLASLLHDGPALYGALAFARTPAQGPFRHKDLFIVEVLSECISERLAQLFAAGDFGISRTEELKEHWGLTDREVDVLQCVAYGMTTAETAQKLTIAPSTARKHLENIHRKTGINNRMSLMRFSLQFFPNGTGD